jgi:hypothetical protein
MYTVGKRKKLCLTLAESGTVHIVATIRHGIGT